MNQETTQKSELALIVESSGLEKTKAQILLDKFTGYFEIAAEWERKTKELVITDISQKAEMKMAREARLFLKEKRVEVEKTRKFLKDDSLREGQTIDAIAKVLKNLIEPIETQLEQKEKFAEIQEANRVESLRQERVMILAGLGDFTSAYIENDLGKMTQDEFDALKNQIEVDIMQRELVATKAEEERLAKEQAELQERERIRLENEALKKEAEEKQRLHDEQVKKMEAEKAALEEQARLLAEENHRKIQAGVARQQQLSSIGVELDFRTCVDMDESTWTEFYEQANKKYQEQQAKLIIEQQKAAEELKRSEAQKIAEKAEADRIASENAEKLRIETEQRQKLEAELLAKKLAEEKAIKDAQEKEAAEAKAKIAEEKKAARQPDKLKIVNFANLLDRIEVPTASSEEGQAILSSSKDLLTKISKFLREKSETL